MIEEFLPSNPNNLLILIGIIAAGAFVIGLTIGRSIKKHRFRSELDKCQQEKLRLSNHIKSEALSFIEDNTIKAIQTRGRSGMAMDTDIKVTPKKDNHTKPKLDFTFIGHANELAKDDLKLIEGIGPFIEKKLNTIGIYKYEQLSKIRDEDIEIITELIEFFPGRIKRDDWKGKAIKLLNNTAKQK